MDQLRLREKAHMKQGDAIAAAADDFDGRVDADTAHWRTWATTLLDAFEGRRMLIAYYTCGSMAPARSSARAALSYDGRFASCPYPFSRR